MKSQEWKYLKHGETIKTPEPLENGEFDAVLKVVTYLNKLNGVKYKNRVIISSDTGIWFNNYS